MTCSLIPHEIDYDFVERKGNKHVSEQAQRGGDDRGLETGRRRASRRGCGAGSGGNEAHDIRVEGEVRGMDVSQAQEAKQLRDENTRLRKLVADLSLDKEALQSVIRKNGGARSLEGGYRASAGGVCLQPAAACGVM